MAVFTLSLSCSDGDDDFRTFLEKHDGSEWLLSNENFETTVYIRFNNYEIILLEQWSYNSELDCYEYNSNIFIPGDFKIKENSMRKLVVECDAIIGPFESMTFSIQDIFIAAMNNNTKKMASFFLMIYFLEVNKYLD